MSAPVAGDVAVQLVVARRELDGAGVDVADAQLEAGLALDQQVVGRVAVVRVGDLDAAGLGLVAVARRT